MTVFDPLNLASWTDGDWRNGCPAEVRGVSHDTRAIEPGNLYVALAGDRFDGHDFVADAFGKGAVGAMVARARADACAGGPLLCVDDTRAALCRLASEHRRSLRAAIVGITGSAGKTTVKEMLARMLAAAGPTASTRGNWNNFVGLPLSILTLDATSRYGVFEIGTNRPGEIAGLTAILQPDCAVVTNIGPAHIGSFGSLENVAAEKAALPAGLGPDGVAVLNRDDAFYDTLRAVTRGRVVSVSAQARVGADYCMSAAGGGRLVVEERRTGESFAFAPRLKGRHNAMNAALALAAARVQGVGWDVLRPALDSLSALPMRWQEHEIAGVRLIDDAYNANPVSMRAAIRTFVEEPVAGRRWLVLAGMLELGEHEEAEHRRLGEFAAGSGADGLIAVGPLGRTVANAAEQAGLGPDRVVRCADNEEAAEALRRRLEPGDACLLKGSRGMRLEEVLAKLQQERK